MTMEEELRARIAMLTDENNELKAKLDSKHCRYDDCWLHGKSPLAALRENVEKLPKYGAGSWIGDGKKHSQGTMVSRKQVLKLIEEM